MFKDFLMRKMLAAKLKGVPKEEQEKLINMIQKNPELFKKIAEEIQAKINGGMDQMTASMEVMKLHQDEIRKLM